MIELFAITCKDLHFSLGPVIGEELATQIAMKMTDESETCIYVPVPFTVLGRENLKTLGLEDEPVTESKTRRGYL